MIIFEQGLTPCGGASTSVVKITLWGAGKAIAGRNTVAGTLVQGECVVVPDASGYWQTDLVPNSYIAPENTTYKVERSTGCNTIVSYISVPSEGGPYEVFTIEGDPMNNIAPSQLAGHAGNLALHGGGIEVDYAELASSISVTGSSTQSRYINGLHVVIPDIARPVYVEAVVPLVLPAAGTRVGSASLTDRWGGTPSELIFEFFIINTSQVPLVGSGSDDVRVAHLFYRVPANTPTTIAVMAKSRSTPYSVTVSPSSLSKASIRAVTA